MDVVPPIGSMSLGIVIGWLVRYFIFRFTKFTPQVLSTVVMILVGGTVVRFLGEDKTVWWFYPIGLLCGFVIYTVGALWRPKGRGTVFELESPTQDVTSNANDRK